MAVSDAGGVPSGGLTLRGVHARRAVAEGLRRTILDGDLSPGQRLIEVELAEAFSATRGGVRAAMEDLAAEGLVERVPNRGARVRVVSVDEAVAILECRGVLEGLIARRAAERVTDREAGRLRGLGDALRDTVETGELAAYSQLNAELHAQVAAISAQRTAADLLVRLRAQIVRHQFRLALRPGRPRVSLGEHLAIVEAVAGRDGEAAERAARAHVASVIAALTAGE